MSQPIRLGIIGLSSTAITSWASTAHLPYLLSPRGQSKYTIGALCNSSIAAANNAIATYGLDPTTTRAYGDPAALAADPDIDLVVCCTRVDTHYALTLPSVKAGKKAAFVEWPLTHDVRLSRDLAQQSGARTTSMTMVGLQGRIAAVPLKIREILQQEGNGLGMVLSSEVRAFGGTVDREMLASGLRYFTEREVGGNMFMIGFAHVFDWVQSVLGEATNLQSTLQLQRPQVKLRDASGQIVDTVSSNLPDLIAVTGTLPASSFVQQGATLQVRFRRGQPFRGEPALTWHICCERGELRLTSPGGTAVHASAYSEPVTIDVHDFATDQVRREEWAWPDWQEQSDLPVAGRSVAGLYEAFYDSFRGGQEPRFPSFEDAVRRHEQLDSILSQWSE